MRQTTSGFSMSVTC